MDPTTPDPIPPSDLPSRAVQAAERLFARMDALDRTLREDMRRDVETLLGLARRADGALDRIAQAEETRNSIAREEATARREAERDAAQARRAWAERLWASPLGQMLAFALVFGLLQALGLAWVAERVAPQLLQPGGVGQ